MISWNITDQRKWRAIGRVYFLRHGMTAGNAEGRYIGGRTDEPLSMDGMLDLKAKKKLGYLPGENRFLKLYMSPMMRCRQTAGLLYPKALKEVIPQWREMDFGDFEGHNFAELDGREDYREWVDRRCEGQAPGGEDRDAFTRRCVEGMRSVLEEMSTWLPHHYGILLSSTREEELAKLPAVCCVVHGGTIMALMHAMAGCDYYEWHCGNGEGVSCLAMYDSESVIHLTDPVPIEAPEVAS